MPGILIVSIVLSVAASLFITWVLWAAMKRIPEPQRVAPAGLVWFTLLPYLGFFVQWAYLGYVFPRSVQKLAEARGRADGFTAYGYWLGNAPQVVLLLATFLALRNPLVGGVLGLLGIAFYLTAVYACYAKGAELGSLERARLSGGR